MNKVIMMGRLTRDPDIRYSQEGTAIARFSLAVDRKFRKEDGSRDADFFNCTAFGKAAEFLEKYIKQGQRILVAGRIQNDIYTNRDGDKVYSVQVIVEELEFADAKPERVRKDEPKPSAAGDGFMDIPEGAEEELPFV